MTNLKSRVLVKGNATWRLTRFSDELYIAKNGFGKQHTFRSTDEVNNFEDYLIRMGFSLRESGKSLDTIKRTEVPAWHNWPHLRSHPSISLMWLLVYLYISLTSLLVDFFLSVDGKD